MTAEEQYIQNFGSDIAELSYIWSTFTLASVEASELIPSPC